MNPNYVYVVPYSPPQYSSARQTFRQQDKSNQMLGQSFDPWTMVDTRGQSLGLMSLGEVIDMRGTINGPDSVQIVTSSGIYQDGKEISNNFDRYEKDNSPHASF